MTFSAAQWTIPFNDLVALRDALRNEPGHHRVTRPQRTVIRRICSRADANSVPPEEFFVVFKQALQNVLQDLRVSLGRDRDELLSNLMTVCIEEFYHGDCGADHPPERGRVALPVSRHAVARNVKRDDECRGIS
jgi:hypothetical protein